MCAVARNRKHHWVPDSYLRAWADPLAPQEPYVHLFDRDGKNHRPKSPGNIFREPELYTRWKGNDRDLGIEDAFGRCEKDFARARRQLEAGKSGTSKDIAAVYAFTGGMLIRTPERFRFIQDQLINIYEKVKGIRIDPQAKPLPRLSNGPKITLPEMREIAHDPMGTWFNDALRANIKALCELFGCDVLVNESEHSFLTSDTPAVLTFPDRKPGARIFPRGLASRGCEITLPISPRLALLFRHNRLGIHSFITADWERVFEINFHTITQAHKTIVSDRSDIFFVQTILDRVAAVDGTNPRSEEYGVCKSTDYD